MAALTFLQPEMEIMGTLKKMGTFWGPKIWKRSPWWPGSPNGDPLGSSAYVKTKNHDELKLLHYLGCCVCWVLWRWKSKGGRSQQATHLQLFQSLQNVGTSQTVSRWSAHEFYKMVKDPTCTAHISRPRCPRRQCKIFQLRGIFSYWICVILCTLCYFTHSV